MNPSPKIVTNEFLVTCIHYEYLKKKKCPERAHRNLCEMMLADDVREDVRSQQSATMLRAPDSPTGDFESECSESSEDLTPRLCSSEPKRRLRRKRKREKNRRSMMALINSKVERPALLTALQNRERTRIDSDDEEDLDMESRLNFLKPGEQDTIIDFVPFFFLVDLFKDLDKKTVLSKNTFISKFPIWLSKLRRKVHLPVNLYRPPCLRPSDSIGPPLLQLASTMDFGKIKIANIHRQRKSRNQNLFMEFWGEDSHGTWIWSQNDIRFFEKLQYQDLAANTFINSLEKIVDPLEFLSFDVQDMTKWSQDQEAHNTIFYQKIKKWPRALKRPRYAIQTKRFYMKILKNRPKRDHPFELRSLEKQLLLELIIRVWDDGTTAEADSRSLYGIDKEFKCGIPPELDIEDRNLCSWRLNFRIFRKISLWKVELDSVLHLRQSFLEHLQNSPSSARPLALSSRIPIDKNAFCAELGAVDGVATYVFAGGSKCLTIQITENWVVFRMAPVEGYEEV